MQEWDFLELLAIARVDLGMAASEFWGLTPAQFIAIRKRQEKVEEKIDMRFGRIALMFANKKSISARDLLKVWPWYRKEDKPGQDSGGLRQSFRAIAKRKD